ncbi:hypothetical protein GJAV_G00039540 [Gymnothorax javanicus]|nr:hypothetical protein GJAV_G00039540 [Gymnothorax javanicus]
MAKARRGSLLDMKEKKAKITKKREREESDEEVSVPYKLYEDLQDKYILILKKTKDNEMLLAEKTAKIQTLQEKNKELSEELKTIRSLNLRLQEQLLSAPGILKKSLPESGSRETGQEAQPEVITPELDKEGKIKIGPRVFLTNEKWQRVQEAKSHSQFCKSLAVAIWGTEELKERSVTGAKSNAVKDSVPKRPLTPEKMTVIRECLRHRLVKRNYPKEAIEQQLALVRRSISEKISDIRRRGPQTEGKPKDSQHLE